MVDDFSVFFKKRNFFLISYSVIESIFLLFVAIAVFISTNLDDVDLEQKYIMITVVIYGIGAVSALPLLFKMMIYAPICNLITYSERLKELLRQRAGLIYKIAGNDNIDISPLQKGLDEYSSFEGSVFKRQIIEWDREITAWIKRNKDNMDKKSYLTLSSKQADIHYVLAQFINSALNFYDKYGQYMEKGKFKAPAIPPMFFDEEDIAVFREAEKNL